MTNKIRKAIYLLFFTAILGAGLNVSAISRSLGSVYLFHLYYDNGNLSADRDFQYKYDILSELFTPETLNTQSPHKGEIINLKGSVVENFQFEPTPGKNSVKAPYVADASRVDFYNPNNQLLLSLTVQESSICNDNNVCETATGEDSQNCPIDCGSTPLTTSPPPQSLDNNSSSLWFPIIYIILGLSIIGAYILIRRHSTMLPPGGDNSIPKL